MCWFIGKVGIKPGEKWLGFCDLIGTQTNRGTWDAQEERLVLGRNMEIMDVP